MKILHLISQYPSKTGSGIYLSEVYKNLKLKGYEQKVLCSMNYDDIIKTNFDDIEIIKFNGKDISFPVVGMSDIMPYKTFLFKDLVDDKFQEYIRVLEKKIRKCIDEFKPDIIFTNHLYIMSVIVGNIKGNIKAFGFCHGTDLRQLYKNDIHKNFILERINKLDGIFSLSNIQKNEINKFFKYDLEKIHVIGGGYDDSFYYKKEDKKFLKNSEIKIIYAGKFSRSKGVIYLLKAFLKLVDKYNIHLILAGSGTKDEYKEIIEYAKKISSFVTFKGYLPMKEIAQIFRECDIFAMPSLYEGLSLVTIEAMACGLRIVTNELENLIDFVGKDIISSNFVEIVKMPKLYDTDKVVKEFENEHIENWKIALEKQILNTINNNHTDPIYNKVKKYTWKNIVDNIEKIVKNNKSL